MWEREKIEDVTADEIYAGLDALARIMIAWGPKEGKFLFPIWRRLKLELEQAREEERIMAEAHERAEAAKSKPNDRLKRFRQSNLRQKRASSRI